MVLYFEFLSVLCLVVFPHLGINAHLIGINKRGSQGCGESHDFIGESRDFSFLSGGRDRDYRIHLPSAYDSNNPQPLLVAYHGRGGSPQGFESGTQFSNEEVNPDMVTVYPAGVNASWQGPSYAIKGVDDAAFTTDLVNQIKEHYCIDEKRVYATGHSNGGGFVGLLACSPDHGGQFAAFAGVAAALYTDVSDDSTCSPPRSPLPVLESHGTADTTIPYDGGDGAGGKLPAIPDWLSRWANRNKCTNSSTIDRGNGLTEQRWMCDDIEGLQRHFKMEGQSHDYPGQDNAQIWISPEIISFLSAHTHP